MQIEEYIKQKREIYDNLRRYIENGNDSNDSYFKNLINNMNAQKIFENQEEMKRFLHLVLIISKNHHRYPGFMSKIVNILITLKDNIKQTFSNLEIFNFFDSNKLIIYYLLKNDILIFDKSIYDQILKKYHENSNFFYYFYPEIKNIIDESEQKKIESAILEEYPHVFDKFEENRRIGENDSQICKIIRNDSLEEFISYVNQEKISFSSQIKQSIFETNPFLLKNERTTIIDYAAYFRSIQILRYIRENNGVLTSTLWLYSIHGRDTELIHFLDENKIKPSDMSYEKCLKESIKCHHNDIANYILINFLNKEDESVIKDDNYNENVISYSIHYQNYSFFPEKFESKYIFSYFCEFDYLTPVDLLIKKDKKLINATIIHKINIFNRIQISSPIF